MKRCKAWQPAKNEAPKPAKAANYGRLASAESVPNQAERRQRARGERRDDRRRLRRRVRHDLPRRRIQPPPQQPHRAAITTAQEIHWRHAGRGGAVHAGEDRDPEAALDARAGGVHRQIDNAGEKAIGSPQHEIADDAACEQQRAPRRRRRRRTSSPPRCASSFHSVRIHRSAAPAARRIQDSRRRL